MCEADAVLLRQVLGQHAALEFVGDLGLAGVAQRGVHREAGQGGQVGGGVGVGGVEAGRPLGVRARAADQHQQAEHRAASVQRQRQQCAAAGQSGQRAGAV